MGAPVPRVIFTCQQCGDMFGRMACETRHKPVRFCSAKCKYAAKRRGTKRRCRHCRKVFYAIRRQHLIFCSRKCIDAHRRKNSHSYPKIKGRHAHRVVMENKLGRALGPNEIVHHRDEDRQNFSIRNLKLTNRPDHLRMHLVRKQSPEHVRKRVVATMRTKKAKVKARI